MDSKHLSLVWSGTHLSKFLDLEIDTLTECDSKLKPPLEASHLRSSRLKETVVLANCYLCVLLMNTMSWPPHIHSCAWHETGSTWIRRSQYVSKVKLIRSFYFLVTVRDLSQVYPICSTMGLNSGTIERGSRFLSFVLLVARTSWFVYRAWKQGQLRRNGIKKSIWWHHLNQEPSSCPNNSFFPNKPISRYISHTLLKSFWLKLSVACK